MNRADFLKRVGLGTVAVGVGAALLEASSAEQATTGECWCWFFDIESGVLRAPGVYIGPDRCLFSGGPLVTPRGLSTHTGACRARARISRSPNSSHETTNGPGPGRQRGQMMRLKCRGCGVTIALRDRGGRPGAAIRVACPKCGQRHTTVIPGHADTDEAFATMNELVDKLRKLGLGGGRKWATILGSSPSRAR